MALASNRKCRWETLPVVVFTVTTGKPICKVQVSMILLTEAGSGKLSASTACPAQGEEKR